MADERTGGGVGRRDLAVSDKTPILAPINWQHFHFFAPSFAYPGTGTRMSILEMRMCVCMFLYTCVHWFDVYLNESVNVTLDAVELER